MLALRFAQVAVAGLLLLVALGLQPANGWVGVIVALACCAGGFVASVKDALVWWLLLCVGLVFLPPWWSLCLGADDDSVAVRSAILAAFASFLAVLVGLMWYLWDMAF